MQRIKFCWLWYFLVMSHLGAWAQFPTWEEFITRNLPGDEEERASWAAAYEDFQEWHNHPLAINSATKTQLEQFPFLSDKQIEGILFYVDLYGPLESVGELQLIPELDYETRRLLSYFIVTDKPKAPPLDFFSNWRQGKSQLMARLDVPFYSKDGYRPVTEKEHLAAPNRHYLGNGMYQSLRYSYSYLEKVFWGATAEKDAGEPFFAKGNRGYDFYSGYLQLKDCGALKNLVVGNYRLGFGLGLVLQSDFLIGKTSSFTSFERLPSGIRKHSGTGETGYYRGAAATVQLGGIALSGFYSYRRLDATLDSGAVRTFLFTGYHRTLTELSKKENVGCHLAGVHAGYASKGVHIGLTGMYEAFDHPVRPGKAAYQKYNPSGTHFMNVSGDYAYYHPRFIFVGETAMSRNGAVATLNSIRLYLTDRTQLLLLQRYYAYHYWALEAGSFSENAEVRNEQGLFLGIESSPSYEWKLSGYVDLFRSPYWRYRVSAPSRGMDCWGQAIYALSNEKSFSFRYRCKAKQQNASLVGESSTDIGGELQTVWTHRASCQATGKFSKEWNWKASADGCLQKENTLQRGIWLGGNLLFTPSKTPFTVDAFCAWFHTDGYGCRIYAYERGLLYAYNYTSYNGHGLRGCLLFQYKMPPKWTVVAKLGGTYYFDRASIGSGAEEIPAPHREDLNLQVRYAF